ncbi:MAG TPA: nitrogenase molybdenum-iron protein subunit alpha, partial [Firmicutes bacterium]|nr:nitrogenase molybdenum-iron protein subunit alpha [Bacillota bacterium]
MPYYELRCNGPIPERHKHCVLKTAGEHLLPACNTRTVPGDMTERGCTFAGCRGVVGGPVKDVVHLVHGPIGCAYYTWDTRPHIADQDFHLKYCFSTDLRESDVVFGGEKRLEKAIREAAAAFPEAKAVFVYATCAVGLIGDDLKAVARR